MLVAGVTLFALACLASAFSPTSIPVLALLFVAVGTSTALVETAEGSHAAELLPEAILGRGFGLIGLVDGVGDLVCSVTVGLLWTLAGAGLGYAVALSGQGALVLLPVVQRYGLPAKPGPGLEAEAAGPTAVPPCPDRSPPGPSPSPRHPCRVPWGPLPAGLVYAQGALFADHAGGCLISVMTVRFHGPL